MAQLRHFIHYYNQYKRKIFNYVLYRVSFDRDLAEDLTSEIFIKAYEHFEKFDQKRPFSPWIYKIAHNHLMNYLVSRKKTFPLEEAKTASEDPSFINKLENKMLISKVLRFVKELTDTEQTIILLRFQHGLSHQEIAEITEKDEGAVRVALSRALTALRQKVNPNI